MDDNRPCSLDGFAAIDKEKFQALCSTETWHVSTDGEIILRDGITTGIYFHGNNELYSSPPPNVPDLEESVLAPGTNQLFIELDKHGILDGVLAVKYFNEETFSFEGWHKGDGKPLTHHLSQPVPL